MFLRIIFPQFSIKIIKILLIVMMFRPIFSISDCTASV
jgi:hypothetical protein